MKILIWPLIISLNLFAADYNFIVENYKPIPGMEFQLELLVRNPKEDHRLVVDCQSFINGIHYMNFVDNRWRDIWDMMLSGNDCEEVMSYTKDSIDRSNPFCMQVNLADRHIDFNSNTTACQF